MRKYAFCEIDGCLGKKIHNSGVLSYISNLNIPFCAEMNAESIGVLPVMISQTKPKIQGGGNHPPW